jgi:hypothetical protein
VTHQAPGCCPGRFNTESICCPIQLHNAESAKVRKGTPSQRLFDCAAILRIISVVQRGHSACGAEYRIGAATPLIRRIGFAR